MLEKLIWKPLKTSIMAEMFLKSAYNFLQINSLTNVCNICVKIGPLVPLQLKRIYTLINGFGGPGMEFKG